MATVAKTAGNRNKNKVSSSNVILIPKGDIDPNLFDEVEPQVPQDAALEGLLNELGDDIDSAKVVVFRIANVGGVRKSEWLFECKPSEFRFSELQEFYGAGDYNVRVHGPDPAGTNYKVMRSNKTYTVGEPRIRRQLPVTATQGLNGSSSPQDMAAMIAAAMKPLIDQQQQMMQMVIGTMGNRSAAMDDFAKIANILGINKNAAPSVDPIEMFSKVLGMMNQMKESLPVNEEGKVDSGALMFTEALKTLSVFAENYKSQRAEQVVAQQPVLPAPQVSAPVAPQNNPAVIDEEKDEIMFQKMILKRAVKKAAQGDEPSLYAALIYEEAPDEILNMILTDKAWFENLCMIEPSARQQAEWFLRLRHEIVEIHKENMPEFSDPLTAAVAPGNNAGNPS